MTMRYFQAPAPGGVYGYDGADPTQASLIAKAIAAGWSEITGSWPPLAPALTLAQRAAAAAVAGLTITVSGNLTLAATPFPTDLATQTKIATMDNMAARGVLPIGAADYAMVDAAGNWHHFTAAQYQAVAAALGAYVSACDAIEGGNPYGATTLPPNSVNIAV